MEIQKPSGGRVKRGDAKKTRKTPRIKPDLELSRGCKRIRGYLINCFAQGKPYHDWDKHAFHRRTLWIQVPGGKRVAHRYPLSVRHIERIVPIYRAVCTEFVWLSVRKGRSTILRVVRADPDGKILPVPEIWRRLVGYIAATVANNGVAHVDQEFLKHFLRRTGLPPEMVHLVWARMRKMAGFRVRWRGVNAGQKMVVDRHPSHTHFAPRPISTYCVSEGIKPKTTGLPPRSTGESSAPLRVARTERPPADSGHTSQNHASRAPPPHGAGFWEQTSRDPPPRRARTDWSAPPAPTHEPPRWPVLMVCGRPVDGRKLARLAALLAVTRMRDPHDKYWRVRHVFVYPRNFAYRSLRDGHAVAEILAAYAYGVERSHEDSLDADRPLNQRDGIHVEPWRVPSAAVAYALRWLREKDTRTREERWSEIFARGPRHAPPVAKADVAEFVARRARVPKPAAQASTPPTAPSEWTARPPRPFPDINAVRAWLEQKQAEAAAARDEKQDSPAHDLGTVTAGDLFAWLRDRRGLTAAQFAALPWRVREDLIARARAFYAQ